MNLIKFMKQRWDIYGEMTVKLVAFPLPPTPVRKEIFMPDSFMTRTFDGGFNRPNAFKLVHTVPSKLGPALLAYVKLKTLADFDGETGFLTVPYSTLCASVSFRICGTREDGVRYTDDVSLDGVTMIHRSCHPGSHFAVPDAPYLTTLLQYAVAPGKRESDRFVEIEYATPELAKELFPRCDFTSNMTIDSFLGSCVIDPEVSFFRTSSGLCPWTRQYIRQLRHNLLVKERV